MTERKPGELSRDEFRAVILGSYDQIRAEFETRFGPGIENFVLLAHKAYRRIQSMESRVPYEERSAWTYQFLFVALNHLACAFHLHISGFVVPAGNLMRQFGEAVAMSLLCSHKKIDVLDRFLREGVSFPAHKALQMVRMKRNRNLLGVDGERWKQLENISKFYDHLSHAGLYSASALEIFSHRGDKSLGGAFDSEKVDFYEREIRRFHSAAMLLLDTVYRCESILNGDGSGKEGGATSHN